jgi:hypothetical protein
MKDLYDQIIDSQKVRRLIGEGIHWSYFETRKTRSLSYRKKCSQCGKFFIRKFHKCDDHYGYTEYDF